MIPCVYRVEVPAGMKEAYEAIRAELRRCEHECVYITVCIYANTTIMINAKALSDFLPYMVVSDFCCFNIKIWACFSCTYFCCHKQIYNA